MRHDWAPGQLQKSMHHGPLGLARGSTRVLRASPEIMASVLGKLIQTPEESERDKVLTAVT